MIVDLILESCIAGSIGARLTLEHDRAAVRHDEAGPDQQHTRLTKCNLAIIDTYQPGPLRHEKETTGRAIEDVFGDLGRDLAGQIRANTRNKGRRNNIARLHDIRRRRCRGSIRARGAGINRRIDESELSILAILREGIVRSWSNRLAHLVGYNGRGAN